MPRNVVRVEHREPSYEQLQNRSVKFRNLGCINIERINHADLCA